MGFDNLVARRSEELEIDRDAEVFSSQLLQISQFLVARGIESKPFSSREVPHFRVLPAADRKAIIEHLQSWVEVMVAHPELDIYGTEEQVLWRILGRGKFRFPPDMFNALPKDGVVEVYTADSRQIYRSLQFFRVCNYTLEEVCSYPWYQLYSRDPELNRISFELYEKISGGAVTGIVHNPFPIHSVKECLPGHSQTTTIHPVLVAIMHTQNGEFAGWVNSFRIIATPEDDETVAKSSSTFQTA